LHGIASIDNEDEGRAFIVGCFRIFLVELCSIIVDLAVYFPSKPSWRRFKSWHELGHQGHVSWVVRALLAEEAGLVHVLSPEKELRIIGARQEVLSFK